MFFRKSFEFIYNFVCMIANTHNLTITLLQKQKTKTKKIKIKFSWKIAAFQMYEGGMLWYPPPILATSVNAATSAASSSSSSSTQGASKRRRRSTSPADAQSRSSLNNATTMVKRIIYMYIFIELRNSRNSNFWFFFVV